MFAFILPVSTTDQLNVFFSIKFYNADFKQSNTVLGARGDSHM